MPLQYYNINKLHSRKTLTKISEHKSNHTRNTVQTQNIHSNQKPVIDGEITLDL